MHVDQLLHGLGKILLGMSLGHLDMPPPQVGFQKHAEIADTSTLILAVPASRLPWLRRQRLTHLVEQLRGTFVEADPWPGRIGRLSIQVQHVLHPPDKLTAYTGETPLLLLPGSAISASCFPASASRSIWARASLRAAMVPFFSKLIRLLRSSSVNWTWYCFLEGPLEMVGDYCRELRNVCYNEISLAAKWILHCSLQLELVIRVCPTSIRKRNKYGCRSRS